MYVFLDQEEKVEIWEDFDDDFILSWLPCVGSEIGNFELTDFIKQILISSNSTRIETTPNGLKKLDGWHTIFYWKEFDGNIVTSAKFLKTRFALIATAVSETESFSLTELYQSIIEDLMLNPRQAHAIRIQHNSLLGKELFKACDIMLSNGYVVGLYNKYAFGQTFIQIQSSEQILTFLSPYENQLGDWQLAFFNYDVYFLDSKSFFIRRSRHEVYDLMEYNQCL